MIIFIKGKLDTLNLFVDEMAKGTENAEILDFRDAERFADDLIRLDPLINESTQVITFNNVGAQFRLGGRSYWESKGAEFYNILVDHPIYYLEEISANFYPKMHTVLIDRGHEAFLKDAFPALSGMGLLHFMPHGGAYAGLAEVAGTSSLERERDIDILYIGSFRDPGEQTGPDIPFCDATDFYRFMENYYNMNPYAEAQSGVRAYEKETKRIFRMEEKVILTRLAVACVEWKVIKDIRTGLLEALVKQGLRIRLYGGDMWKDFVERYPDGIDFGGMVSPWECLDIVGRSKILISFQPFFGEGGHERIFNGMRNGAVVFTNRSRYLEERFTDGEDLFYYDTDCRNTRRYEETSEKIRLLLSDGKERERIASNAYRKSGNDLWKFRLKELLQKG